MEVILLQNVSKVGKKYEVKKVADGYALHLLFPRKLARQATSQALKEMETKKAQVTATQQIADDELQAFLKKIKGVAITITEKANEEGHLFGALHEEAIVDALKNAHKIELMPDLVQLESPIKEVGEHVVRVGTEEKNVEVTVEIVAE